MLSHPSPDLRDVVDGDSAHRALGCNAGAALCEELDGAEQVDGIEAEQKRVGVVAQVRRVARARVAKGLREDRVEAMVGRRDRARRRQRRA